MNYILKTIFDHVEVYDGRGQFIFSADTWQEAMAELRTIEAA